MWSWWPVLVKTMAPKWLWLGVLKKIIQEILSKYRVSGLCSRGSESVSQSKAWECAFPRALHMTLMCSRVQESATLSVIIVANSKEGWFCPISGDRFGCCIKDCYWHSMDRNQGCFWTSYSAQDGPFQQGIIRLWVSTELRPRSPVLKCARLRSYCTILSRFVALSSRQNGLQELWRCHSLFKSWPFEP